MEDRDRKLFAYLGIILLIMILIVFFYTVYEVDELQEQINLMKFESIMKR